VCFLRILTQFISVPSHLSCLYTMTCQSDFFTDSATSKRTAARSPAFSSTAFRCFLHIFPTRADAFLVALRRASFQRCTDMCLEARNCSISVRTRPRIAPRFSFRASPLCVGEYRWRNALYCLIVAFRVLCAHPPFPIQFPSLSNLRSSVFMPVSDPVALTVLTAFYRSPGLLLIYVARNLKVHL